MIYRYPTHRRKFSNNYYLYTMNAPIKQLIDIALSQVGVREEGGNNNGAHIREFQQATWLKPDSWAWCAAFVDWCLREWLHNSNDACSYLGLKTSQDIDNWRNKDASAFGAIKWAQSKGLYITDEKEQAKAGDLVVFDFSHIGIVSEDQLPSKDYIQTIEGNTNGKGERDSVSGDGVWSKYRKTNLVKNYIRIIK